MMTIEEFLKTVGKAVMTGLGAIVAVLLILAIIGACAFVAFEAWAWALNG